MAWLVSPAAAQTAEAIHAATQAGDQIIGMGPIGALFVIAILAAAVVIVILWRALGNRDVTIAALNEKRADLAARIEGAFASNKAAVEQFARVIEAVESRADDRGESVKEIQRQLVTIAQLIGVNGEGIKEIRNDLLKELLARTGR